MKKWPPWAIALVVTVSVHAVIVGWLVWRDAPPPIAPVTVVLKDAKALTRVSVLQRSPKAEPPSPPGERVGVRVKAVAEPTVVVARPSGDSDVSAPDEGASTLTPTLSPGGEGAPGGEVVGEDTPPTAPAVDFDALVHTRLVDAAAQCYPPAARRFKQQGTALVWFCADAAGALTQSQVKNSSGSELLDKAATECVLSRASPFPSGAEGRCYTLPIRFTAGSGR